MEIGLYTFANISADPHTGRAVSVPQRYRELLALARLAEDAGLGQAAGHPAEKLRVAVAGHLHLAHDSQIDLGAQPYAVQAEVIELLGTRVAPALRKP